MSPPSGNQIDLVDNSNRPYRNQNMSESESQNQGGVEDKENVQPGGEGNMDHYPTRTTCTNEICVHRWLLDI